jgi:general stress protein YciG
VSRDEPEGERLEAGEFPAKVADFPTGLRRNQIMAEKERGFAAMDQHKQREIARKGGRAAHQQGTAHEFTPEEAAQAGRKGGQRVSRDRQHMARIGRKGGLASHPRNGTENHQAPANPDAVNQAVTPQNAHLPLAHSHEIPEVVATTPGEGDGARGPEEQREPAIQTVHLALDERRDEGDLDSEEMLAQGRMGNENATLQENHTGVENGQSGHISERLAEAEHRGGHGYGSYELEKSPQMSH